MSEQDVTGYLAATSKEGEPSHYRLTDIDVPEVAVVDRAANKRIWLLLKRDAMSNELGPAITETDDGTLTLEKAELTIPTPVKAAVSSVLVAALEKTKSVVAALRGADEDPEAKMDSRLSGAVKSIAEALGAVTERYPSPTTKTDKQEPLPKPAIAALTQVLQMPGLSKPARAVIEDLVSNPAPNFPLPKPAVAALSQVLQMPGLPKPARSVIEDLVKQSKAEAKKSVDPEVADAEAAADAALEDVAKFEASMLVQKKFALPAAVKAGALRLATGAMELLASVGAAVRAAKETSERLDAPLPKELGAAITRVAAALKAINERYPAPKSAADGDGKGVGEKEQPTVPNPDDAKKNLDIAGMRADLAKMQATIDAAESGAPPPTTEPAVDIVEKAESLVEELSKAGARMAKARLARFLDALKTLNELGQEFLKGDDSVKTPDFLAAQKSANGGLDRASLEAMFAEQTRIISERVGTLEKRVDTVETARPVGVGDSDPPVVPTAKKDEPGPFRDMFVPGSD